MGTRDTMLHELRHVFADAIGLLLVTGGDAPTYRKALVLLDARADGSGEAATYIPGRENDPEITQANAIGAIGPVAALVETPRELIALVSRGDGDTLKRGLSGRDLHLLAQAEPGHVLLAAVATKFLEQRVGPGRIYGLAQILQRAVNQNLCPLELAEIVPLNAARAALQAARREVELAALGERQKHHDRRTGYEVAEAVAVNELRRYT